MGARGPQPLPSALKIARGTFRPDRAAINEAKAAGKPTCPAWLTADEKTEFRRLVKELSALGLVGKIDGNALARYARTWCRWRRAEADIEKYGPAMPVKDKTGKVVAMHPSPFHGIAMSLSAELNRLEQAFGLTPSARSRIAVSAPTSVDPTDAFFAQPPTPLKLAGGQ